MPPPQYHPQPEVLPATGQGHGRGRLKDVMRPGPHHVRYREISRTAATRQASQHGIAAYLNRRVMPIQRDTDVHRDDEPRRT